MMMGTIGSIILPIITDAVSNKGIMPRKNFAALSFGFSGIFMAFFALLLYIMPTPILIIIIAISTFFGNGVAVLLSTLIPEYLPREITATAGGIIIAAQIPLAILPPIAGIIIGMYGKAGWIYAWLIAAMGAITASLLLTTLKPSTNKNNPRT